MSIPELDVLHANRIKDLEAQLREKDAEIERLRLLCAGLRDVIDGKTKSIEQIRAARSTPAEERE
jgi:predicted RNase H-like nuclease (RuvC/YqgF family)